MRKLLCLLLLFGATASVSMAAESLKVDFTNTGGLVQEGFQPYYASHEQIATFTEQSYEAFGTSVSVLPTWATGAVNTAMQMINRAADDTENGNVRAYPTDAESDYNLICDWIGTDLRQAGDPLTLTISGLPAGEYFWKTYHNDVNNISQGAFILTITDASGTRVEESMTSSNTGDPAAVMVYETLISSNGSPISFSYDGTGATDTYLTMVLVNGFELTQARTTGSAIIGAPLSGSQFILGEIDELSWSPAIGDPNVSAVTKYDLLFTNDSNFANPNAFRETYTDLTETTFSLSENNILLDYGTTYYWRVDSYVTWDSASITTNPVEGNLWSFSTIGLAPVIVTNPVNTLADADGNVTFTGTASIVATDYRWFKVGTESDTMVGSGVFSEDLTATLTITGATTADEGEYYFIAYNGDSDVDGVESEPSATAKLWTRRLTSHFDFETLVDGVSPDSVGGFDVTMNKTTPEGEEPVADVELVAGLPELGGNALSFGNNTGTTQSGNYGVILPGVVDYNDITISAWFNRAEGSAWQRLIDCGHDSNRNIFISPSNGGQIRFAIRNGGDEYGINTAHTPVGEWTHVTATITNGVGRLYVNGEHRGFTNMPIMPIDIAAPNNYIGRSNWPDPYFNGVIDDLKIYCYARSTEEIALDYLALKGEWICDRENYNLPFDFDDNCRVDMLDFAEFARTWMDSYRIYPAQE